MAGINKVILIGNLGRDPELRHTTSGIPVANFTMATTERWSDQSGERQERTEWHKIVVWNKQAEICNEYLTKGKQVYVEGSLQTREWTDRDGNKRYTTEVKARTVQMLGRATDRPTESQAAPTAVADGGGQNREPSYEEDDVPF